MKNLILMLVVMLALACQATASTVASHEQTVVSAFLGENYIVALLSVLVLVLTMI
jgi:hypothetical protein